MTKPAEGLVTLRAFRQQLYRDGLGHRQDSLFDLLDAVLTAPGPTSLVRLSLAPAFRRRWPSTCDALSDGTLDIPALRRLLLGSFAPACGRATVGVGGRWHRLAPPGRGHQSGADL